MDNPLTKEELEKAKREAEELRKKKAKREAEELRKKKEEEEYEHRRRTSNDGYRSAPSFWD